MSARRQPHRIPPPIDRSNETLDAELLLREFPDEVGLALWKSVRSVRLWTDLPPEERDRAFAPQAHERREGTLRALTLDSAVVEDLQRMATVLRGGKSEATEIAEACRRVSEWAEGARSTATALEFAQAAACVSPRDATLAYRVAELARERQEYARAETWYRQAIAIARQTRDRKMFGESFLGLGLAYLGRGNYAPARKSFIRALRIGKRYSLRSTIATAYHELTAIAIRTQKPGEVVRYARAALTAYGSDHPLLPSLAHDVAVFWRARGYVAPADEVLHALPPDFVPGDDGQPHASSRPASTPAKVTAVRAPRQVGRLASDLSSALQPITTG